MDSDAMTYNDGVNTQTAVSMIETTIAAHPPRSQACGASTLAPTQHALLARCIAAATYPHENALSAGTGKSVYQETFSPRGPVASPRTLSGRGTSRQTPMRGYRGGQDWLFEAHQDKGTPAHLQSHNIL